MTGLTQFLSDMMGTKAEQQKLQQRFAKSKHDAEKVMKEYGLTEAQQAAVNKRDYDALGKHVGNELKQVAAGPGNGPIVTNW